MHQTNSRDHHETAPNPFFTGWIELVLRFRWVVILTTVLITAGLLNVMYEHQLAMDNSPEAFVSSDSEVQRILKEVRREFGDENVMFVVAKGDVFSTAFLDKLRSLHEDLADIRLESISAAHSNAAANPTTEDGFVDDEGWGDEDAGSLIDEVVSLVNVRETRPTSRSTPC